jgi:hypothetical protein
VRVLLVAVAVLVVCGAAPAAWASAIVDRNAKDVRLSVGDDGTTALVEYTTPAGKRMHVLAWGAVNALQPQHSPQVKFKFDYSGGWGRFRQPEGYRRLHTACGRYDGPDLPWLVTACKASDGSYWALQSWQRMLPNLGLDPWSPAQSVWELHLSHWRGALPRLEIHLDWVNTQRARHLFGRLTYLGVPVHGWWTTKAGAPLDSYGRNVYLDVLDAPAYGPGWRRENSFVAQNPGGNFCYGFYPHQPYPGYPPGTRGPGVGVAYRATVIGPGVLPDVGWEGTDIGDYDPNDPAKVALEQQANALADEFASRSFLCHQH